MGAWHWGQRLDPPESALQVWRLYIMYPCNLDVCNHQCSDDRSDRRYFSRMVCISNETADLEQCAGASPVSIVLEI